MPEDAADIVSALLGDTIEQAMGIGRGGNRVQGVQ